MVKNAYDVSATGGLDLPLALHIGGGSVVLPTGGDFTLATYVRLGPDLGLQMPDGQNYVVPDYFLSEIAPALMLANGGVLLPATVQTLVGANGLVQVAQLGTGALASAAIGSVTEVDGTVIAARADGSKVTLQIGDSIYQGDVLETGDKASVGLVFADDTTFSLGEDAKMTMDEMVYDPDTQSGTFGATVLKGTFSFVSGQIAKTSPDAMALSTPIATIGIRGSTGMGKASGENQENTVTLVPDVDGNLGELVISTQAGTVVLNVANGSTTMTSAFQAPGAAVIMSQQEIQQKFGATFTVLTRVIATQAQVKAEKAQQGADVAKAEADQAKAEADQAKAEAAQAEDEAAQAEAEAEAAQAEAEAAQAEAEAAQASGDPEAIAAAEAKVAEAEAKVAAAAEKVEAAKAQLAEAAQAAAAAELQAAQAGAAAEQAQAKAQSAQQFSAMASTASTVQAQSFAAAVEAANDAETNQPDGPNSNDAGQNGQDTGPQSPSTGESFAELAGLTDTADVLLLEALVIEALNEEFEILLAEGLVLDFTGLTFNEQDFEDFFFFADDNDDDPIPIELDDVVDDPSYDNVLYQWASDATASTEYDYDNWSAFQATGEPNTFTYGDIETAWTPEDYDIGAQWLEVTYDIPVYATGLTIYESNNSGSVYQIDLIELGGTYHTLWLGKDNTLQVAVDEALGEESQFSLMFSPTSYLVTGAKIYVHNMDDWNEIDAVKLLSDPTASSAADNGSILGTNSNDTIFGDGGDDLLEGGSGSDTIDYFASTDGVSVDLSQQDGSTAQTISASQGDDTLFGFEFVAGSAYDDTLIGDVSDNQITGRGGVDTLTGGDGNDIFIYLSISDSAVDDGDIITDFNVDGDILNFRAMGTGTWDGTILNQDAMDTFTDTGSTQIAYSETTGILQLDLDGNSTADMELTLHDGQNSPVAWASLDSMDFSFDLDYLTTVNQEQILA